MAISSLRCALSVCDKSDTDLVAIPHILLWNYCVDHNHNPPPAAALVLMWEISITSFHIFLWFQSVLSDLTQHSCWLWQSGEVTLIICESCLHVWSPPKNKLQHTVKNGKAPATWFLFFAFYCLYCPPNRAQYWRGRVWNSSFSQQGLFCFLAIAFVIVIK